MPEIWSGLLEKHVFYVGRDGGPKNRVEFLPHLLEQRRNRAILLRFPRVIEFGHLVSMAFQYMPQRILKQRRYDVERAGEIALKKPAKAAAVRHDDVPRHERALREKSCKDVLGEIVIVRDRSPGDLDFGRSRDMAPDALGLRDLPWSADSFSPLPTPAPSLR